MTGAGAVGSVPGDRVDVRLAAEVVGSSADAADAVVFGRPISDWRRLTRSELGLDPHGPLVVTGHQPGPWHGGILAKYAVLEAAKALGAKTHDILVSHEIVDPFAVEIPVSSHGDRMRTRRVRPAVIPEDRAIGWLAPVRPRAAAAAGVPAAAAIAPRIRSGLERWSEALHDARTDAGDAAAQAREALADVFASSVALPRWTGAASLLETSFGRAFAGAMVDDPWDCAAAYAAGVRSVPEAGIPSLVVRDDFVELPVWRIDASGRRRRADDVDLAAWLEGEARWRPAPRALMLTALVRLGLADVFVHGTGGAVYDAAMERWIERWLGVRSAPVIVATADVHAAIEVGAASADLAGDQVRLVAGAHRIWHDPEPSLAPASVAGAGPGPVKRELLAEVDRRPRGSAARRRAYRMMHRQLEALRGLHAGRVESARRRARHASTARVRLALASRRDWFAGLVAPERVSAMADAVRERVPAALAAAGVAVTGAGETPSSRASRSEGPSPASGR